MKPVYAPTPFSETLFRWLQATKGMPKFSRHLANFVKARQAYRIIRLTPTEKTPDYRLRVVDPHTPLGRYNEELLYLTNVTGEIPWTSSSWNNSAHVENRDIRGTRLGTVIRNGSAAVVYTCYEPMAEWSWEDVTLDFWERYMQIGTCLFDYKHTTPSPNQLISHGDVAASQHRWEMLDEQTAKCRWCGDILHLHRSMDLQVHVHAKWSHTEVTPGKDTFRCHRCHRPHPIADMYQTLNHAGFKSDNLCPSCFLARAAGEPSVRRALINREMGRFKAIIKA